MQEFKAAFQLFTGGKETLNVESLDKALKKFGTKPLNPGLDARPPTRCPFPDWESSPSALSLGSFLSQVSRTPMPRT